MKGMWSKGMWSDRKKRMILRLFTVLFAVSVSAAVIPGGIINAYGLFGEVKAFAAIEEQQEQEKEAAVNEAKVFHAKGINLFNVWFELLGIIACLTAVVYMIKLPRGRTIVTLKVRMDD